MITELQPHPLEVLTDTAIPVQSPEGTLLVMDPEAALRDRKADPTKRIWCIYEFYHTLQLGKPLLIKVGACSAKPRAYITAWRSHSCLCA